MKKFICVIGFLVFGLFGCSEIAAPVDGATDGSVECSLPDNYHLRYHSGITVGGVPYPTAAFNPEVETIIFEDCDSVWVEWNLPNGLVDGTLTNGIDGWSGICTFFPNEGESITEECNLVE
jgi:hypothetical protein